MTDHQKNLLILQQIKYLEEYFDIDENKKAYGITESGIKALIVWNKIHGLEDHIGITISYPNPISLEETEKIFSQFIEKMLITTIWNPKLQTEDHPPSKIGQGVFESLNFFTNKKIQKNIERKNTLKQITSAIMTNLITVTKKIAESSATPKQQTRRRRRRKRRVK